VMERAPKSRFVSAVSGPARQIADRTSGPGSSPHPSAREPGPPPLDSAMRKNAMTKALIVGATALALSAGAACAQGANYVYPNWGYAPYGYGYAATAPLYDYASPGYGYAASRRSTITRLRHTATQLRLWHRPRQERPLLL
jgi:hypothetical protein